MSVWPQLGIAPGPVLRVFGMRRSGNHAVINWLQRNAPQGRALFFNDCTPGRKPFETHRAVEIDGARAGGPGADARECAGRAGNGAALIFSYEDAMPNERRKRPVSVGVDENAITHDVVICRSFLNWSASLLRKVQGNAAFTAAQRVTILLKAVETYGRMLELVSDEAELGIVAIRYDDWIVSPAYRAGLLGRLGFEARDDSLGEVQRYGNGSSFQADAAAPEDLRTASRWREMEGDPEYRIVLWLAAQDAGLRGKLARVFPEDAATLAGLAAAPPPDFATTRDQTAAQPPAPPKNSRRH